MQIVKCQRHSFFYLLSPSLCYIFSTQLSNISRRLFIPYWSWIFHFMLTFLAVFTSFFWKQKQLYCPEKNEKIQKMHQRKRRQCCKRTDLSKISAILFPSYFLFLLLCRVYAAAAIKLFLFLLLLVGTSCLRVIQNLCVYGKKQSAPHTHTRIESESRRKYLRSVKQIELASQEKLNTNMLYIRMGDAVHETMDEEKGEWEETETERMKLRMWLKEMMIKTFLKHSALWADYHRIYDYLKDWRCFLVNFTFDPLICTYYVLLLLSGSHAAKQWKHFIDGSCSVHLFTLSCLDRHDDEE